MLKRLANIAPFAILSLVTFCIFYKTFFYGLLPFPADFQLAWYEPWKSDHTQNGVITLPHKPIADDIFRQLYPMKILGMDMVKAGQWPLWNPYNGSGQPLLATMHVGLLNPLNAVFFFFDNATAWSIQVIVSVLLVGITTYLFARKVSLTREGALFSGITCMLSGFVITRSIYNDYNFAFLCLPLLLYLFEDRIQHTASRIFLLFPLVVWYMFMVVQPQIIFLILLFVFSYIIIRLKTNSIRGGNRLKELGIFFFLLFLGIGIASLQLFQTFELYQHANVTSGSSKQIIERFLLPPTHLISIAIPNYFGNQATYNYWGSGDYVESVASVGIITILFCWIACVTKKEKHNKTITFFALAAFVSALLTLDHFSTRFLYSLPIPLLSTGVPSRIFLITTFSLCMLSGFGVDYWRNLTLDKKFLLRLSPFLFFVVAIILYTGAGYYFSIDCHNPIVTTCRTIALRNTILETAFFVFGLSACIAHAYVKHAQIKKALVYTVLGLIIFQGFYNAGKFLPFTHRNNILPPHEVITDLKERAVLSRIFGFGSANIKTNFATHYRFFDPNYYDPLYIKRYGELIAYANTGDTSNTTRSDVEIVNDIAIEKTKKQSRDKLLSLLSISNVLYATSESDNKYYLSFKHSPFESRLNSAVPRAHAVTQIYTIPDKEKQLRTIFSPSFNEETSVVLEKQVHDITMLQPIKQEVIFSNYTGNFVTLETKTSANAILVLNDNYYPGWKAFIDGKETEVLRANYTFRAIVLPEGHHSVLFSFEPSSFRYGLYSSFFFLFLYILFFRFWPKVSRNKK